MIESNLFKEKVFSQTLMEILMMVIGSRINLKVLAPTITLVGVNTLVHSRITGNTVT